MIVWLVSYPRSGNTFLRIALHRMYGVPTYSVYDDDDPVAQRVGPELLGYLPKPADRRVMIEDEAAYFLKTHKRRKADGYPAIYLVRDGRDAIVSNARFRLSQDLENGCGNTSFEELLREEIARPYVEGQPSSGTWGGNVLSWLNHSGALLAVLRYEDLIVNPLVAIESAVSSLLPGLAQLPDSMLPSFEELRGVDSTFFRRGVAGSYRDEMPDELHDLFWAQTENVTAMQRLGYA